MRAGGTLLPSGGSILYREPSPQGGGTLDSKHAQMCVSKSEGHGSFFGFNGVK